MLLTKSEFIRNLNQSWPNLAWPDQVLIQGLWAPEARDQTTRPAIPMQKVSLISYQTYIDMWSIFGVKLNYIVIFEKSCNSSTLLMELFMICGHNYSYD